MKDAEIIADLCVSALRSGNKIMFCGNGGSAADAQHLAAELVGKLNFDRPPLAAMSLTTDTSILTAVGNDYGFEHVFSRQVQALGKSGDVLIAMSTSGNSGNVLEALIVAKQMGIVTIGKSGETCGRMLGKADYLFQAPYANTQEIQEYHMKIGHTYCGMIEEVMFGK